MTADRAHFDAWAPHYDQDVRDDGSFPFRGYDAVLEKIVGVVAALGAGLTVLDVGCGTGNLTARLARLGGTLWATDFSAAMLEVAAAKVPQARFYRADLTAGWPGELPAVFDAIVASYVLHEFDLATKVRLLARLLARVRPRGAIVVGDIAFATRADREAAKRRLGERWDPTEHYWAADETAEACAAESIGSAFTGVADCAGVFVFRGCTDPRRPGA